MRRYVLGGSLLVALAMVITAIVVVEHDRQISPRVTAAQLSRTSTRTVRMSEPRPRDVEPYRGLGAWVDAFDYSPPYAGDSPPVSSRSVDEMAEAGVKTIYLQAGRIDSRSPGLLEDQWLVAEFLFAAHQHDMAVVGWFLPKWGDGAEDLDHLRAIVEFSVLGQRFDGIAVDIEYTSDENELDERNRRLVELSRDLRELVGPDVALGAIVLPPVVTEVVNPDFWPLFPWRDIAGTYNVWLPMSYWSNRTTRSGYKDGYTYNEESTRRLRNNIGVPDALVHGIGGIGVTDGIDDDPNPEEPLAKIEDLEPFLRSLRETGAIGGSIYDWQTTEESARVVLAELFADFG